MYSTVHVRVLDVLLSGRKGVGKEVRKDKKFALGYEIAMCLEMVRKEKNVGDEE